MAYANPFETKRKRPAGGASSQVCYKIMAEREGFEPSIRGYRIHAFQACAFNHSATSPQNEGRTILMLLC